MGVAKGGGVKFPTLPPLNTLYKVGGYSIICPATFRGKYSGPVLVNDMQTLPPSQKWPDWNKRPMKKKTHDFYVL